MDKAFILDEIRRTAEENGGQPLGVIAFGNEAGVGESDRKGVYWIRWSDAVIEAGYSPNQFTSAIADSELAKQYVAFAIELGHLPVDA